ncbi:MAG: Ig-like domain-containing protein, partial [Pseudomonadales bacterium]|nr:Ig-like domain-containing protein [Pseudomonadales bacterium]
MAITAEARNDIITLVVGMFDAAPGNAVLTDLVAAFESGQSLAQLAATLATSTQFTSVYPNFLTAEAFATKLVETLVGDEVPASEKAWAVDQLVAEVNAGRSFGEVAFIAIQALSAVPEDEPNWGNGAARLNNKVEVATFFTVDRLQSGATLEELQAVIADVTSSQASVDAAEAAIDLNITTFSLSGQASVNEGASAIFTLETTGVDAGSSVAYTLTGVDAADVVGGALTGTAIVGSNGNATITVALAADLETEGAETLQLALDNGRATSSTTVNDTSVDPVFTVVAGAASANEGSTITFEVSADAAINGSRDITVSGIDAADATSIPTTVDLVDGKGTVTIELSNDATTEGAETVTVAVGGASAATTVNDTSVTPVLGTDEVSGTIVSGQGTAIILPSSLLGNDTDSTGATATGTPTLVAGSAVNGEVFITQDGNFLFVGASGARTGSFQYEIDGITGQQGTVNVTLNTAPVLTTSAIAAVEDTAIVGSVTAVDADNDTLTFTYTALNGTVVGDGANFTYTPNADFNGNDTITVVVNDGFASVSQDIAVTVAAVDDAPAAVSPAPAAVQVNAGSTVVVDLTQYATDVDSPTLTYTADTATTVNGGSISITGNMATITYPEGGGVAALGDDSFTFSATDGTTPVNGVTVNLNVTNTAPVAADVALSAKSGITQTVDVVSLASDADGNTLTPTVTIGSLSSGGSAEVINGEIVYTSTIGFVGTETVKFTVNDGFGGVSEEKTITFTVVANTGGTSGADLLFGSTAAEVIDGLAGNDTITGGGGLDTITGGTGDDRVTFSDAAVQILGAAGQDTLVVNSDAVASTFDLSLATNQNTDASSTNSLGNRVIIRTFENLDASKASGNITLTADNTATTSVKTGSGTDTLTFTNATGAVSVETNDGADTITFTAAAPTFTVDAGGGNDTITTNNNNNVITGGEGNDTVTVGTGTDNIDGGAGNDRFVYNGNLTSADTVAGGDGTDTIRVNAGVNDTVYTNVTTVETIELAAAGTTTLGAKAQAAGIVNVNGAGGAETISATAYTAGLTFNAGATGASVATGSGNDTFVFAAGELDSGVTLDGNGGTDTISFANSAAHNATLDFDDISDIESVVYSDADGSGTAADAHTLTIEAAASTTNTITIDASAITSTNDTLAITNAAGTAQKFNITGGAGADTLAGAAGADTLNGGGGNDTITTGNGNNVVDGGAGNDTVTVGTGNDNVTGGAGNDTVIFVANLTSADTVAGGDGTDTVSTNAGRVDSDFTNISSVETLTLASTGNTTLGTTAQAAGIVTVNGNGGAETISATAYTAGLTINAGATGASIATGSGNDTFVFAAGELDSGVTLD